MARPTKRRRSNGSVRFKRSKNLYEYRYLVGDIRKGGYAKTKAEADDKLNRALIMISDGNLSADDPKFSEYVSIWLESKKELENISDKTLVLYRNNLKHLESYIGNKKLSQIRPTHLEQAYSDFLKGGLKPSSVNSIHRTVRTLWNNAFKKGLVNTDVTSMANAPSSEKRNPEILSRDDWRRLIDASYKELDGVIIHFALKTGMRIDVEALSTTWDQIDLDSGTVKVGDSKTDAGVGRVIPLDDELIERLKTRQLEHDGIQMLNPNWNPTNLVLCNQKGNKHALSNLSKRLWKRIKKSTNIADRTNIHDLRHNCGSYLLSEGVPITTVSKILGHADPSITLKIYAHELPEDLELVRVAMNKLSKVSQ